ncbi:carboxymuconolactone decarboxylase family protein [Streptomyces sp. NPDC060209]|uniref:carboxymuconolactone decarboxylase family protein n=1 Tax=Streptomyces sp. NPDC060209 TaxID=3347073 RepID=UPI00365DDEBE
MTTTAPNEGTDRFERGMGLRREVLGDAHVSRSVTGAEPSDLQRLIAEIGWGTIWARPGLPRQTRSMLTVVMLMTLNRGAELKVHLRGALNNGCTQEEIREAILHGIPYCGFPAAIDAMRVFDTLLAEENNDEC